MDYFDTDAVLPEPDMTGAEADDGTGDEPLMTIDEFFVLDEDAGDTAADGGLVVETPSEEDTVRIPVTIKHEI